MRHSYGSLISSMIGSTSIMQSQRPVIPIRLNHFIKYGLDLMIGHLNLTTNLNVIGISYFVNRKILSKKSLKRLVTKVTTSISNKSFMDPVLTEYDLFHKLNHHIVVIGPSSLSFYPLWHIINSNQYVHKAKKYGKGTHKINAPPIKYLNNQNRGKERHITMGQGNSMLIMLISEIEAVVITK